MYTDVGRRYTELMAPGFIEGLESTPEVDFSGMAPQVRIYESQPAVAAAIRAVDWDQSGLPRNPYNGDDESKLTTGQYAERLRAFAYGDAAKIIKICEKFGQENPILAGVAFGVILRNSKHALLRVGRIDDESKDKLLIAIETFGTGIQFENTPSGMDPLVRKHGTGGNVTLAWNPVITKWIDERIKPDVGCPAARMVITNPLGQQQTLMHYFWDKLIDTAYPGNAMHPDALH